MFRCGWVTVNLRYDLSRLTVENDHSAVAVVTSTVRTIYINLATSLSIRLEAGTAFITLNNYSPHKGNLDSE